jgi:hypothetical protein
METHERTQDQTMPAYYAGRQVGFGIAALTLGCVSFLSLLGLEKAVLAMVLGSLAMRGAREGSLARRLGFAGIALGILFIIMFIVIVTLFHEKLMTLIQLLKDLS